MEEFSKLIKVANSDLKKTSVKVEKPAENWPDDAELVYSEYSGRFWKPLVKEGDIVEKGQGLVVIEAMKTEMVVNATKAGKVLKVLHKNGDIVEAGDLVVVLQ